MWLDYSPQAGSNQKASEVCLHLDCRQWDRMTMGCEASWELGRGGDGVGRVAVSSCVYCV